MDRVQRSGVITLILLLMVAVGGFLMGPNRPSEEDAPPAKAVLDPELAVEPLPPSQRTVYLGAEDFQRGPSRSPTLGSNQRDWNRGGGGTARVIEGDDTDPQARGNGPHGGSAFEGKTVRVRRNETLIQIARRELGDETRWKELAAWNGIADPSELRAGQSLRIPAHALASSSNSEPGGAEARGAERGGREAEQGGREVIRARQSSYVVKRGDTASEISQAVYGSSKHWSSLLAANGIARPEDLRPGQRLRVPDVVQ